MPNEGRSDSAINSQTFGFFSAAAIEEAVQLANQNQNEDDKQHSSEDVDGGWSGHQNSESNDT